MVKHLKEFTYRDGCVCINYFVNFSIFIQTGGDGCICYLEYNRDQKRLEFIGMKQVKELSLVQSVFYDPKVHDDLASGNYAIGFASADFIIWNLISETKVLSLPLSSPSKFYTFLDL